MACGTKNNLQPHHIIPCHQYDKELFVNMDNGAVLCQRCHDKYHGLGVEINRTTFEEFCKNHSKRKASKKVKNLIKQ